MSKHYPLQHDQAEVHRLNKQYWLVRKAISSTDTSVVWPGASPQLPAVNLTTVLDVGCGSAFFLQEVRKEAPHAELFGIDITSAKFPQEVPEKMHLLQHDLTEDFPSSWQFDNKVDLINVRFSSPGVDRIQGAIRTNSARTLWCGYRQRNMQLF